MHFHLSPSTAIGRIDGRALEGVLRRAALALGPERFLLRVLAPVLAQVGDRWHAGALSVREEHFASACVRNELLWLASVPSVADDAPRIVVATPSGERHELGALMVAAMAAFEGWQPVQLGADLPVSEIAAAAESLDASAVALSIVFPVGVETVVGIVRELRDQLPPEIVLVVGGAAVDLARNRLRELPRVQGADLPALTR